MSSINGFQPGGSGNVYHTNLQKTSLSNVEPALIQKLYGANKGGTATVADVEAALDKQFATSGTKRNPISADPAYDAAIKKAAGKDGKLSADETHNLLAGLFGNGKKLAAPAA